MQEKFQRRICLYKSTPSAVSLPKIHIHTQTHIQTAVEYRSSSFHSFTTHTHTHKCTHIAKTDTLSGGRSCNHVSVHSTKGICFLYFNIDIVSFIILKHIHVLPRAHLLHVLVYMYELSKQEHFPKKKKTKITTVKILITCFHTFGVLRSRSRKNVTYNNVVNCFKAYKNKYIYIYIHIKQQQ